MHRLVARLHSPPVHVPFCRSRLDNQPIHPGDLHAAGGTRRLRRSIACGPTAFPRTCTRTTAPSRPAGARPSGSKPWLCFRRWNRKARGCRRTYSATTVPSTLWRRLGGEREMAYNGLLCAFWGRKMRPFRLTCMCNFTYDDCEGFMEVESIVPALCYVSVSSCVQDRGARD